MRTSRLITSTISLLFLAICVGCAPSSVSYNQVSIPVEHPIQTIALAPDGGLLADAIGVELSGRGYLVVDTASVSRELIRLDLSEIEILQPRSLDEFRERGVDVILSVRSAAGHDGLPQSASARLNSTHTGQIVAGVTWQNGWGCVPGSPCDRLWRDDIGEVASDITDALVKSVSN